MDWIRKVNPVNPAWNLKNQWIADIHHLQHVPIDSIVLFGLCRNAPLACTGFITASSRFAFLKESGRFFWNYNAYVYNPKSSNGKGAKEPWSGITDYAVYFELQTMIRTLAGQQNVSPLLYEMSYLWTPAEQ